ncbi:LysE family transporter [uncultured Desulfovibrio sp.]|uniref:LysE family translocator n=1 Tax=uncultured Desulfovibrio sp. TaxID=167968 RepID=UPI002612C3F3|nr:LysE family transporter [uncultured Desulfovibrio sp.]
MELLLFCKSMLLGLAVAAPLGPIGVLCINRALERGFWAGVAGGLGTALADAIYASLAAIGFSTLTATLAVLAPWLKLPGGLFMLWLACKSLRPNPRRAATPAPTTEFRGLSGTIAATFLLTLTNPVTIFSFAAIFAGLGLTDTPGAINAVAVVAGVFLGSLLWWFLLSGGVALAQRRLPEEFSLCASRMSGIILMGFGFYALGSLLYMTIWQS